MGEIVGELDTTTVLLYAFWAFFGYLCFYLQKESRREGYPLETDEWGKVKKTGVIFMPDPKTFRLPHGHGTVQKPDGIRETRELKLRALEPTSGTPYEPTGNPMLDGIGPGAYAERADVPDVTLEGEVKIVPLRAAEGFELAKRDPNPIGMEVVGCDKEVGGTITDVWVDKSERMIRFYEVAPADGAEGDRVLLPVNFAVFRRWRSRGNNQLYVHAITGSQFAHVPQTKKPDEVTMLEEEKVFGYFGGGLLYATPRRVGPALL